MKTQLAKVFLVEDSLSDIVLTKAILKTRKIALDLEIFRDGSEVLQALQSVESENTPHLVLLDFNLPKVSGEQVLKFLQTDDVVPNPIPVIMLTGSEAPGDRQQAANLGAIDYMIKPLDEHKLAQAVDKVSGLELVQSDSGWSLVKS